MRKPTYLSPSALAVFERSKDDYYLQYIAEDRPPRMAQTNAMAAGSAFDAYIKSFLHDRIYGKGHKDAAKYELQTIFEAQVEPAIRDEAFKVGAYLFACYKESGALADLMLEIQNAVDEPQFEFTVQGIVEGRREGLSTKKTGVPLLGKPDLKFINSKGAHAIFDFKVNGFYSKSNTSPMQGYVELREQDVEGPHWQRRGQHKNAFVSEYKGMRINVGGYLETYNADWATQLSVYSWLMGESVGSETLIGVDQLVCNGAKRRGDWPLLRIASHRLRVSQDFQYLAQERFQRLWNILIEEPFYFFREYSLQESQAKCLELDKRAEFYRNLDPASDEALVLKWATTREW